jgi:energy-coupling factor transporter ATP-binding protein EcfA2
MPPEIFGWMRQRLRLTASLMVLLHGKNNLLKFHFMGKTLILLRGLPGSGKSTLAETIGGEHVEADQYFMVQGQYQFQPEKLKQAHEWCRNQVQDWMFLNVPLIVVSNTFTQEWEMEPYFQLGEKFGYRVSSVIVENRHFGQNSHGVPADKLDAMRKRFEIML